MKYLTREEAHKADYYYSVCDPFGSESYPVRFSTLTEAKKERYESNISGDLVIVEVNVIEQTTKEVT